MNRQNRQYGEASIKTANSLRSVAQSEKVTHLTSLTLPEIDAVVNVVSDILPAGNVPSIILSNLISSQESGPQPDTVKRDINLLYKGLEKTFGRIKHGAKFAGPAAVLWGYQNLLKLAGKETTQSFPDGLWQFYLDYAFREDQARHTLETHAFDTVLRRYKLTLSPEKRITAWVMGIIQLIHQYDAFVIGRWRERTYISILQQVCADGPYAPQVTNLWSEWERIRPFSRGQDAKPNQNYAAYRRAKFDQFLQTALAQVDQQTHYTWNQQVQIAKQQQSDYQRQMSLLVQLEAGEFNDQRRPLSLQDTCIGLIYQNRYYLLPVCQTGSNWPVEINQIETQIAEIIARPTGSAAMQLSVLTQIKRSEWSELKKTLNSTLQESLNSLRHAPIIFNADQRPSSVDLSQIREAERGVGDHPLTIFDAQRTAVFDASPLVFDSYDLAEVAEVITHEALAWGNYIGRTHHLVPDVETIRPLTIPFERTEQIFIQRSTKLSPEITSENDSVQVKPILALQKMFKMRHDLLNLEVSDLLILYLAIHHITYQPDPALVTDVTRLKDDRKLYEAAEAVEKMWERPQNPSVLIPQPAYQAPRERVYPLLFEVPVQELDLIQLHEKTLAALEAYETDSGHERQQSYETFDLLQREYLATLAGFGQILTAAKQISRQGESRGQEAVKMIASLPPKMKNLFTQMSNQSEQINNILRGNEIFEWLDMSMSLNSISRFQAGKEDSPQKHLVWSALLDVHGSLNLTLRDFRPELLMLYGNGRQQLAQQISRHYLSSYAGGFNTFVGALRRITKSSRETQVLLSS